MALWMDFQMKITFFILVTIMDICKPQATSDILETITIEEGKMFTKTLVNLTEILLKKQLFTEPLIKDIKIYPISDSNLYPFKIYSGELLHLSNSVDRESVCSDVPSNSVSKVCPPELCCQLLGFQYKLDLNVHTFFILVKILDINDQEPKFKPIKHPYMKIPENIHERFVINLPVAEDKDSQPYSVQRYTISQSYPTGEMTDFQFLSGNDVPIKPRLIVSAPLDYEKNKKYKFKFSAYDSPIGSPGNSCSTTIEIEIEDINDNTPKFDLAAYNVEVKENELIDNIFKWKVFDADSGKNGMVTVFIDNDDMSKKFQVTKTKTNEGFLGLITPLDYENDAHLFQFDLVAQDHGTPSRSSSTSVKIRLRNVNDNSPKIKFKKLGYSISNTVSVKEGLTAHSLVAEVRVTDADTGNNEISCRLLDYTDIFYLDQSIQHNPLLDYKSYNLKTISVIDRESDIGPFIRITVQCSDGDSYKPLSTNESLNIQIDDVNDNPPVFSQPTFVGFVDENQINTIVKFIKPITVTDKDFGKNQKLEFIIEDFKNSTDSERFLCDKNSGKILTQKTLDFEVQNQFRFKLIAKDQGYPSLSSSANIEINVVDLNDNPPVFSDSHYTFSIPEDSKAGTKIGSVFATDKDFSPKNKAIRYDMEPKSGSADCIEVDKNTGEIRTRRPLDRELYESITFRIIASNPNPLVNLQHREVESEVQVIIKVTDINDNPPEFKLKPNVKPRIEFVMEQYVEGSTCAELPYTIQDADDEGTSGPHCCVVSLENDYENLVSLMTNTPSYICLMRRPLKYQSLTITLIAKDHPSDSQKSLTSKISFPLLIKTDPNLKINNNNNNRLIETADPSEPNIPDSRNIIIIAILTTVVLVFLIIIIIIIIIIRRCSMNDNEYNGRKCNQNESIHANINILSSEQNSVLQSGKMTIPRGYITSQNYSDSLLKTVSRNNHHSQSTASSPFTPPVYHQIMTNQGIRIVSNPRQVSDQYLYEWAPGTDEQQRLMTVSRSVLNSSSEKDRPLSPTRSESLHQSKNQIDTQHDSGYQILNPFSSSCSPQRQAMSYSPEEVILYDNNENRSVTLLNNFFDEGNNDEANKMTPMTMKRNYFQTTFV